MCSKLEEIWPVDSKFATCMTASIPVFPVVVIASGGDALTKQVLLGPTCGCEMQRRELAHQYPIHLLGKRLGHIPGPEPRFDMPNRNSGIECRQSAAKCCRCVALDQDNVGFFSSEHRLERGENPGGHLRERLTGLHHRQIVIWLYIKDLQNLVEHLAMLTSDADANVERAALAHVPDQRAQFNRFGAGTEDDESACSHCYQRYQRA